MAKYHFIQVTARKDNGDFALCSNLSLMDSRCLTPAAAEVVLTEMAAEYAAAGYNIEWTREEMQPVEVEIWKGLFERAAAY